MDTHKIDDIIKQTIDNSGDFYTKTALESKLKIWNSIQNQNKGGLNKTTWLLVAASILLLFCSGYLLISQVEKTKIINLVYEENQMLQNELNKSVSLFEKQKLVLNKQKMASSDTVLIEKEVVLYKTIVETIKTVDTLFVEKIVYVENQVGEVAVANNPIEIDEQKVNENNFSTMQIDYIQSINQKTKQKRFKVNFGGNKENENSENLAFKTEL